MAPERGSWIPPQVFTRQVFTRLCAVVVSAIAPADSMTALRRSVTRSIGPWNRPATTGAWRLGKTLARPLRFSELSCSGPLFAWKAGLCEERRCGRETIEQHDRNRAIVEKLRDCSRHQPSGAERYLARRRGRRIRLDPRALRMRQVDAALYRRRLRH